MTPQSHIQPTYASYTCKSWFVSKTELAYYNEMNYFFEVAVKKIIVLCQINWCKLSYSLTNLLTDLMYQMCWADLQ